MTLDEARGILSTWRLTIGDEHGVRGVRLLDVTPRTYPVEFNMLASLTYREDARGAITDRQLEAIRVYVNHRSEEQASEMASHVE